MAWQVYDSAGALKITGAGGGGGGGITNVRISAGTTSNLGSAFTFADSNGVFFGLNGSVITGSHNALTTAAASNHSHGNPQLNLTNASGTTASNSAGFTLSLSVAAAGLTTAAASNHSHGNPQLNLTNLSGTTASNSAGLTLSLSAAAPGLTTAAASNHSHGNPQLNLTNLSGTTASNSAGFTLSLSAAAPGGGAGYTMSRFNPFIGAHEVAGQQGLRTLQFHPMPGANAFQFDRVIMPVRWSHATNSTGSMTLTILMGFYTRTGSSLSRLHSTSSSQGMTYSGTVNSASRVGTKLFSIGWTTTISQNDYWIGVISNTSFGGNNGTLSQVLVSRIGANYSGFFGAANNATVQCPLGLGQWSATTSALPASVAFSQISGTGSIGQRPPLYYFVSGTA